MKDKKRKENLWDFSCCVEDEVEKSFQRGKEVQRGFI